ncbi:MAG: hypothetical protein ACI4AK_06625 [Lepagella sp.]
MLDRIVRWIVYVELVLAGTFLEVMAFENFQKNKWIAIFFIIFGIIILFLGFTGKLQKEMSFSRFKGTNPVCSFFMDVVLICFCVTAICENGTTFIWPIIATIAISLDLLVWLIKLIESQIADKKRPS